MNTPAIEIPSPPTQREQITAGLEHQLQRAKFIGRMLGHIGVNNTLRSIHNRVLRGEAETAVELPANHSLLRPLHMTTRPSDIWSYDEVISRKVYQLPSAIESKINGLPIVDLGAYIGIASAYFASQYPDSRVISVEPHPRNQELLYKNAARYGGQIEVVPAAIAPTNTPVGMEVFGGDETNYMANYFGTPAPENSTQLTSAVAPPDIVAMVGDEQIGLLKIDIEGAEAELFDSPNIDPLLAKSHILMIETHERFKPGCERAVAEAMKRHDFRASSANQPHTSVYIKMPSAAQ